MVGIGENLGLNLIHYNAIPNFQILGFDKTELGNVLSHLDWIVVFWVVLILVLV